MALSTVIINVAYVSLFASTFTRTVPRLRSFLIVAAVCFIVFGSIVGNWSMVVWNVLTGALNCRQLILHARTRRAMQLSDEDETFRQRFFADLDGFDFASLWSMGEDERLNDEPIITAGVENHDTWLVLDGTVEVRTDRDVIQLAAGALVGEMSLVSGALATADVRAVGTVRARRWAHGRLHALDALNPRAGRAFHRFLERDLTYKVLDASDVRAPHV